MHPEPLREPDTRSRIASATFGKRVKNRRSAISSSTRASAAPRQWVDSVAECGATPAPAPAEPRASPPPRPSPLAAVVEELAPAGEECRYQRVLVRRLDGDARERQRRASRG